MPHELPDDLSHLGDRLTAAAARDIAARRRRASFARRMVATAAAAALAIAVAAPGTLAPSVRDGGGALFASERATPGPCEYPRGEWQTMNDAC